MNQTIAQNKQWIDETWEKLDRKLSLVAVKSRDKLPYTTVDGTHDDKSELDPTWWTNGFWGGMMWLMYEATGKEDYRLTAQRSEQLLDKALLRFDELHHDVGFMWHLVSGASYRLTGNRDSRLRNLYAAATLASRYNVQGDYIQAWNGEAAMGYSIIDCLMNLPLLYWASDELQVPRFRDVAVRHMDMALHCHNDPKLYLVEVELNSHDVYGHIGEQILRFGISTETDKYKLKNNLLTAVSADNSKKTRLAAFFKKSKYDNINELLDKVVFENKPAAIIVIDEASDELFNVMSQLTMTTEVIEAQTYVCGDKKLYRFSPFKDDVLTDLPANSDADELDTIVVPAREDGFNEEFLKNDRWFAIRISGAMIDKIKYIAAYQVAPVSGITYVAEVARIDKYQDTNKYIVIFKPGTLKKLNKVALGKKKGCAPQAPRYASYQTILNAKTLDDIWN